MDASVFPPPPYNEGWPGHPGMGPPFRPEFPSTSTMNMGVPFQMNPNDSMPPCSDPNQQPPMNMPNGMMPPMSMPNGMMSHNGMFPPQFGGPGGPVPMNFPNGMPNGMQRFPNPGNFSPGFPPNGMNSPSLNDFGPMSQSHSSPFGAQGDPTSSTSNTPMKNGSNTPFSPPAMNGFDTSKPPSRFLFTSDMANKAIQAVKTNQFESPASWHMANYPSTSQGPNGLVNGMPGKEPTQNTGRGVKRKASSQSIDQQNQQFNHEIVMQNPGSANPDFNNPGNPFSNENSTPNNDFMRPSSVKSEGVSGNENDPLRCIQRMTEQVDEAPASKISRSNSETLNDKNKRNNQETSDKLRRLNEIESKLLKQPMADGQNQRMPPYFGGPFPPRMPFMPGGPMPPGMMGPNGPYDSQMMGMRPPFGPGMPPGPFPIGPNGMPMMPNGMMPQAGPRGMMPPNGMPGNFPPNMFPGGPGPMHSPSFGGPMTPTSSTAPQMMHQNMPFPPGSIASPGPMGEPSMPPPYHMATSAGMMQASPRFPGPGQGMPQMGPNGMMPPGMMPMNAMRPGFPGDMGMVRGPCPPDGFPGWSPHQMPQPLTNLESRVPTAKVHYMPQK